MSVFNEICDLYEKMSAVERGILLKEKAAAVFAELSDLFIQSEAAIKALAGFIIGTVTADGRINEKEYLLIYPALVKAFGEELDFAAIKASFRLDKDCKGLIASYTEKMLCILSLSNEKLKWDIITLCLCVASVDGKISPKKKRYIRGLCEAKIKAQ